MQYKLMVVFEFDVVVVVFDASMSLARLRTIGKTITNGKIINTTTITMQITGFAFLKRIRNK